MAALGRRDFAQAEREITGLLAQPALPTSERAFLLNKRGVARIGQGAPRAAREDFNAALELAPAHAPALTNLGNLLLEQGDVDGAIARYRAAIAADHEYAIAYLNLGVAYKRSGRIAESVRALREAQRLEQKARRDASALSWRSFRRP
jgi:tetratricopeptide (TPR) repeat protein